MRPVHLEAGCSRCPDLNEYVCPYSILRCENKSLCIDAQQVFVLQFQKLREWCSEARPGGACQSRKMKQINRSKVRIPENRSFAKWLRSVHAKANSSPKFSLRCPGDVSLWLQTPRCRPRVPKLRESYRQLSLALIHWDDSGLTLPMP